MVVSPLMLPASIRLQPTSANSVPVPVYAGPRGYLTGRRTGNCLLLVIRPLATRWVTCICAGFTVTNSRGQFEGAFLQA